MAAFLVPALILGVPVVAAIVSKKKSQQAGSAVATAQDHVPELSGTVADSGGQPVSATDTVGFQPIYSHEASPVHAVVLSVAHPQAIHALRRSGMAVHHVKVSSVKRERKTPPVVVGKIPSQAVFNRVVALPFVQSVHKQVTVAPSKPSAFLGASSLPNPVTTRVSSRQVEGEINARLRSLR